MSKTVHIGSPAEFNNLISKSTIVVTDFYADWCGPCKAIAPIYEQLSAQLSRPNKITFTKVDTDKQVQITRSHGIQAMPTFLVFKNGKEVTRIQGADAKKLSEAVKKLAAEAESSDGAGGFGESSASGGAMWQGAELPRGYGDITDQIDIKGLDLLNSDSDKGNVRTLFNASKPSALDASKGKNKAGSSSSSTDCVESDTDEQLMLFVPFQSTLKLHTIQITSVPPPEGDDETPMRPKTIHLYTNRSNVLGFEEAEDLPATQTITLAPEDWDAQTSTAKIELRFVKFQKVASLVIFIADGDGDGDKVRIDRIRFAGESGEKRAMGELKKIGDEPGE